MFKTLHFTSICKNIKISEIEILKIFIAEKCKNTDDFVTLHSLDILSSDNSIAIPERYSDMKTFLSYVVPTLVADIQHFKTIQDSGKFSILYTLLNLVIVRHLDKETGMCDRETFYRKYDCFMENQNLSKFKFDERTFNEFIDAVFCFSLTSDLKESGFDSKRVKLSGEINRLMNNTLYIPHELQAKLLNTYATDINFDPKKVIDEIPLFCSLSDDEFKQTLEKLKCRIRMATPLELASVLFEGKKSLTSNKHEKKIISSEEKPNNIMLENSIAFHFFRPCSAKENLVLFPSPAFVKRWHNSVVNKNANITFVFENDCYVNLMKKHFSDVNCCSVIRENFKFLTFSELISKERESYKYDNVIFFNPNECLSTDRKDYGILVSKFKKEGSNQFNLLCSIDDLQDSTSFAGSLLLSEDSAVTDIIVLPRGLNTTKPRQKILCRIMLHPDCDYFNCLFTKKTKTVNGETAIRLFSDIHSSYSKDYISFIKEDYKAEYDGRYKENRNKAVVVSFTPEINIFYTLNPIEGTEMTRVTSYIKTISEGRQIPVQIKKTIKDRTCIAKSSVEDWILKEYPYSEISVKEGNSRIRYTVREVVANEYRKHFIDSDISLASLVYIHPEAEKNLPDNYLSTFRAFISGDFAKNKLSDITPDVLIETVERFCSENNTSENKLLGHLSHFFDCAVEDGNCSDNCIDDILSEEREYSRKFRQLRTHLAVKTFSLRDFSCMVKNAKKKMFQKNGGIYLGILIKALTGMGSNEVCALQWSDLRKNKDYGFDQLTVYSQVTNDGMYFSGFNSTDNIRILPCSPFLSDAFRERILYLKECGTYGSDMYIVEQNGYVRKNAKCSTTPYELSCHARKIANELKVPDIIEIPDSNNGTTETNLANYHGDVFRENMRFWLLASTGFSEDEIQYYLGNRRSTTLGIHYHDFKNDASQLIMYGKLKKLDRILTGEL